MNTLSILGAAVALSLLLGFGGGVKYTNGQHAIKEQAREVNQRTTERLQRQNSNTAAIGHEADKIVIKEVFVPVTKEIERVVNKIEYRDRACFDDDGLRVFRSAISRANGDTSEPGNPVPKAP